MAQSNGYPKHPRSIVNRYKQRAAYDFGTVHSIVNTVNVIHVNFPPADPRNEPFSVTLPTIGHMGRYDDQSADPSTTPLDLYIHGHSTSRIMRRGQSADESGEEGLPVTVAATILDGIVLALTPFHHDCNYRSALLFGYGTPVTDPEEKVWAMRLITNGLIPNRWENSRVPPTDAELKSTTILKIRVVNASAKVRVGGPGDDRKDIKDEQLLERVWTGVVPVWEQLGECKVGEYNKVQAVPEYIDDWRKERNGELRSHAEEIAEVAYGKKKA